ncbi:MAG: (Fe-S)-binding protein [Deltaproteobacteria bacterium]|nr:(Fe-S)-binding protein [Deltaproteobacteria bacterium]MBW2533468.1 (Fe-S)-binding protein [Deltaproteobacteria bacterium]
MQVGLFVPCFIDLLEPEVAIATVELLERQGLDVAFPAEQTCCGQAHFNAGHRPEARRLAQRFCRLFDRFETVVCPSGSCTAMVRVHYRSLLEDCPVADRVFELCEFLSTTLDVTELGARLPGRAVLHVGCHGLRSLGLLRHARRLLAAVEGLTLVETATDDWCCGFGGTFSVKYPEVSTAMGKRKLEAVLAADVDYLVSTDTSCLMHLRGLLDRDGHERPRLLHVAQVLASSGGKP